ncbi:MAG: riboflavin synthase [Candidatus Methylomirabilales bacterium]
MFGGIIQHLGTVKDLEKQPSGGRRLTLAVGPLGKELGIGQSLAVNGVCLTITRVTGDIAEMDLSPETLSRTTLGRLRPGTRVNLEAPLCLGDPLGGHLVAGHVDGVGRLVDRLEEVTGATAWFRFPVDLAPLLVEKGSIAVDGVSLTIVSIGEGRFSVALIPHTLTTTTLGALQVGDEVNLEVDMIGRYVHRVLVLRTHSERSEPDQLPLGRLLDEL